MRRPTRISSSSPRACGIGRCATRSSSTRSRSGRRARPPRSWSGCSSWRRPSPPWRSRRAFCSEAGARPGRVCWTTHRPRPARRRDRRARPRRSRRRWPRTDRIRPRALTDRPGASVAGDADPSDEPTGQPGTVRISVIEGEDGPRVRGPDRPGELREVLRRPNAAVWVDLVSPTPGPGEAGRERARPPSTHRRGRPRGQPAGQDPDHRGRRPHRPLPSRLRGRGGRHRARHRPRAAASC